MNKKTVYIILWSILVLFTILIIFIYFPKKKDLPDDEVYVEIFDDFNFNLNKYYKISKNIENNQTLGGILNSQGISYSTIDAIDRESKDNFDLRNIVSGKPYHLYYTNDSLNEFHYFIYEISKSKYLQIYLKDSISVQVIEKDISTCLKTGKGIITSSLWNAMKANNLEPDIAIKMSEIFAWVIDFYRIQKNDRFKLIYESNYANGEEIGSGIIKAIMFEHNGKTFYAYHFEKDTINAYFNENGESLKKAFLKAPIKYARISSGFSNKRFHPVLKTNRPHFGTDYAAPTGTPIMSVGDGEVIEARYHRGNGNYVKIRHNSVYSTQYLHMSKFAKGIKPGVRVNQGDIIGYVGSTGLATGPHVCFRFWKNGVQVNHLKEEFPNTAPLDSTYHNEFFKNVYWYKKGFEKIDF